MRVCVVGAGPAGLTTIKQLLDEGHEVVCFEKNASIGGIWYRHEGDDDETKAYDDLVLTISMKLMSFSDFMIDERRFFDRERYLGYLRRYAEKFQLERHIRFNSTVMHVQNVGHEWRVAVTSDDGMRTHTFAAVAVCQGPFTKPKLDVPHIDGFEGDVVHSSRYRNNEKFRGKKVLVIGLAESGADILREISDVSAKCTLSIRSRSLLVPRLFGGRFSTDMLTYRANHYEVFVRATEIPFTMESIFEDANTSRLDFLKAARLYGLISLGLRAVGGHGDHSQPPGDGAGAAELNNLGQSMWPLKLDLFTPNIKENVDLINEWNRKSHDGKGSYSPKVIYCKNVSFIPNIAKGKIVVQDGPIVDIRGRRVHFEGGLVEDVDAIVLCTGFENDFSVMEGITIPNSNVRYLYKHAFHPQYAGRLALIGFVRPFTGGIPICAEMQARYFALLCSGKLQLPADVADRIEQDREWEESLTTYSPRHFEAIPSQILFLDSIAKEIGCLPNVAELLKAPALLTRLWLHSFNQACYRLTGPHSMYDKAYRSIMREGLPGNSIPLAAFSLAMSLLPSHVHPRDADLPDFPISLRSETRDLVVALLGATAENASELFQQAS